MIVVDTNIVAYLMMPGDLTPVVEAVLRKDPYWIVPKLWRSEFCSVLSQQVRAGILELKSSIQILRETEGFLNGREFDISGELVLVLSADSGCSSYDCEFIVLAQGKSVSFVTADKKIIKAFPEIAFSPEAFLSSGNIT